MQFVWLFTAIVALSAISATQASTKECVFVIQPMGEESEMVHVSEHALRNILNPSIERFENNDAATAQSLSVDTAARGPLLCLDGRSDSPLPAVEGGDVGMLIVALQGVANVRREPLGPEEIENAFRAVLETADKSSFSMCTSDTALERLCASTGYCANGDDLTLPPPTAAKALSEAMGQALHVGDDTLRGMVSYPNLFDLDPVLPSAVIQLFFKILWNVGGHSGREEHSVLASKLDLSILRGTAPDNALLELQPLTCSGSDLMIPTNPTNSGFNVRIRQPAVAAAAQRQLSNILASSKLSLLTTTNSHNQQPDPGMDETAPFHGHVIEFEESTNSTDSIVNTTSPQQQDKQSLDAERLFEASMKVLDGVLSASHHVTKQDLIGDVDSRKFPHYNVNFETDCCPSNNNNNKNTSNTKEEQPQQQQQQQQQRKKSGRIVSDRVCPPKSISISTDTTFKRSPNTFFPIDSLMIPEVRSHFEAIEVQPVVFSSPAIMPLLPVDGRVSHRAIFTPGGSVGAFAAAFVAHHFISGHSISTTITQKQVDTALLAFLSRSKIEKFAYSLDSSGLSAIVGGAVGGSGRLLDSLRELDQSQRDSLLLQLVLRPTQEQSHVLLPLVLIPQLFGDNYLSFVCNDSADTDPDVLEALHITKQDLGDSKILAKVVPMVIRGFFKLLWSQGTHLEGVPLAPIQKKLEMVVVEGDHDERGWATVSNDCDSSVVPVFAATNQQLYPHTSLWIQTEGGDKFLQQEFSRVVADSGSDTDEELLSRMARVTKQNFRRYVASKQAIRPFPIYSVHIDKQCCPSQF